MKRLYLIALFIIVSLAATAWENGNRDAQNRIVRGPYETNRFFDNIFVGVAGEKYLFRRTRLLRQNSANAWPRHWTSMSENGSPPRSAPASDTPGLQAKGWTDPQAPIRKGCRRKHVQGEIRRIVPAMPMPMWNFSNAVSGYKETRTWNFVPFVGVGWARSYGNDTRQRNLASTQVC